METMNADALREITLKLPLDDLLHFCSTSKAIRSICSDGYFWRARIQQDFPEVPEDFLQTISLEKMRDYYLIRERFQESADIQRLIEEVDNDPERVALNDELERVENEVIRLQLRKREIDEQLKEFRSETRREMKKREQRVSRLAELVSSKGVYQPRYIEVKVDPTRMNELRGYLSNVDGTSLLVFEDELQKRFGINLFLHEHDLIGFAPQYNDHLVAPHFFAYVAVDRGHPWIDAIIDSRYPSELYIKLTDAGMTSEEFEKLYKFPYHLGDTEEDERRNMNPDNLRREDIIEDGDVSETDVLDD